MLPSAPTHVPGHVPTDPKAIPNISPPVITPRFIVLTLKCDTSNIPVMPANESSTLDCIMPLIICPLVHPSAILAPKSSKNPPAKLGAYLLKNPLLSSSREHVFMSLLSASSPSAFFFLKNLI